MAEKAIDKSLLEGLTFRTSKEVEVKDEEGKKKKEYQKIVRPLTPEDVLDWKDNGARVTIVTRDGKKHEVEKKAAARK